MNFGAPWPGPTGNRRKPNAPRIIEAVRTLPIGLAAAMSIVVLAGCGGPQVGTRASSATGADAVEFSTPSTDYYDLSTNCPYLEMTSDRSDALHDFMTQTGNALSLPEGSWTARCLADRPATDASSCVLPCLPRDGQYVAFLGKWWLTLTQET